MYSTLAEKTTIDLNVSKKMYPFYEEGDVSFYKNKLIHIEDIIEQKEIDRGNAADFKSFETKVYHLLTFQDEMGNTHEYQSTIKPKNVGGIMYYVVENGKIKDVFSESDKIRFKNYIHINTKYKHPSKIHNFINFCTDRTFKLAIVISLLVLLVCGLSCLSSYFADSPNNKDYILSFALGLISYFVILPSVMLAEHICGEKLESFIQKKQNEERDAMLEKFI